MILTRSLAHLFAKILQVVAAVVMYSSITWAEIKNPTVSIAFVGDVMLDQGSGEFIERGGDPFTFFSGILHSADFQIGNLECVVATTGVAKDKPYTFRAHPRTLKILNRHFTALSLANNHSGDFGTIAFSEMLDLLNATGLLYFGGGRNLSRAHAPLLLERNGLKIALLGFNEFLPRSFEADFDKPGIAWSEDEQVQYDIKRARTQYAADIVIPFIHWGWEDEDFASDGSATSHTS